MLIIIFLLKIIILNNQSNAAPTAVFNCVEYNGSGATKPHTTNNQDVQEYDNSDYSNDSDSEPELFNYTSKPGVVPCNAKLSSCFAVWTLAENNTVHLLRQGCWQNQNSCTKECIGSPRNSDQILHQFCCCTGEMCNANFTNSPIINDKIDEIPPIQEDWKILYSPLIWICTAISAITLLSLIIFTSCRFKTKPTPELAPLAPSGPGYSSNLHNVDNLKLCAMIGQGKYGTVWKGMINEQPVAVKIFPAQYKQYFLNERDIYTTPFMDSPSLLSYFGCDQRRTLDDNSEEYLLVMSLAPLGCLQDWLMVNNVSFQVFYKMAKSITRGISHLHTQICRGNNVKPCICHRDLNSKNILVKSDLTCCICDFGFALKTFGPRYEYKGEMTLAETKSINEVGTLRYMAPEILEGAVNLRDCESALKQIDVYSLGLILWELCLRCYDFYRPGETPPPYQAPYEAEIGKNPSFEQMQILISRHKTRPKFPIGWGNGSATEIAKETCEDCWDNDAEARLTSLCVEERLSEIANHFQKQNLNNISNSQLNNLLSIPATQFINGSPNNSEKILVFTPNTINLITSPPNQVISDGLLNKNNENTGDTLLSFSSDDVIITTMKDKELYTQHINQYLQHNKISNSDNYSAEELLPTTSQNEITFKSNTNNISDSFPKHNGLNKKLKGWHGVRALIQKKLFKKNNEFSYEHDDKSNLVDTNKINENISNTTPTRNTRVDLLDNLNKTHNGCVRTKIDSITNHNITNGANIFNQTQRPKNLNIRNSYNENAIISPITVNGFKSLPNGQTFTVIKSPIHNISSNVNKIKTNTSPRIVVSKSANAVKNLNNFDINNEKQIKRQRSLEVFREVFNSRGSCERLRDPSQRVKTPGDVPPSVRKVRASKTLSLYDDRMMDISGGNTL